MDTRQIMHRRFRQIHPWAAGAILAATLAAVIVCVFTEASYRVPRASSSSQGDLAMYDRIQKDMRAGADYYSAAHAELLTGTYGTRSVFNWRTPLYPWLLSRFPSLDWPQKLLGGLALVTVLMAFRMMRKSESFNIALATAAFLILSLIFCFMPSTLLFSELAAGTLIVLSVSAYGLPRPVLGYSAGLTALFFRELAAPYILICFLLAWYEKRHREMVAWMVGLFAYAIYFTWHFHMVQSHIGPNDPAYASGWIQFGGLGFVISTAAFNGVLLILPLWIAAIVLPLSFLGLLEWRAKAARRMILTVAVYLATFSVIGKPFNDYWGLMYAPILSFGLPWVPAAIKDLIQAIRPQAIKPLQSEP
jgi:hypothetical protein